jgi:hypothetical protein
MRLPWKILAITLALAGIIFLISTGWNKNASGYLASNDLPDSVSYNFDIRPILSDKCFTCHGPDANKRKADLRMDDPVSAYAALKEHPNAHALVAGKPELSEAYLRITSTDTAKVMPPYSSPLKLTPLEIKLIERWIEQGARYEKHWAFVPPRKSALPTVEQSDWPRNEIDHFILSQQEQMGLSPNDPADKERLLRRVCLDLTGLPPTVEMMDRFLSDNGPTAYEKVVDQLLQQPAYGEKMAIHWLDLARYADSYGYQDDGDRKSVV